MRFRACAIVDAAQGRPGRRIDAWRSRWKEDVLNFSDTGCGCCVHVIEFDASDEAIIDLARDLDCTFERHPEGTTVYGE